MNKTFHMVTMLVLGLGGVALLLWLAPIRVASADARLPVVWASPAFLGELGANREGGAGAAYLTLTASAPSGDGTRTVEPWLPVTKTIAGGGLIRGGQHVDPVDLAPREIMTETRWISFDGREPMTFAEWQAQQPPPPPLRIERMYVSSMARTDVLSDPIVSVLVNPAVYDDIAASLAVWIADVEAEGRTVLVQSASFPDPPALRAHLAGIPDLDGCLLVGDFPVPWLEWNDHEYPFDFYLMDLDGTWVDADLDGMYDDHVGAIEPEIWVGRLQAGNLDFSGNEVSLLNNYFYKNHAYRTGDLILPSRALVYVDDDWAHNADNIGQQMEVLFPDTTVVSELNATTALDYGRRLTDYYAWIHVFAHSTAFQHNFSYSEGEGPTTIYNLDVLNIDPHTFFYNLFACGAARFVERNYLSGWYVFGDTYGLLTIGSTTGGSMVRGFDRFHTPLAQGQSVGAAFRDWFAVEGIADPAWHYGLTLHGDPTLSVVTDEQVGEAPFGLSIAGPAEGVVGAVTSLTGTVDPGTATQPLRYTWQATGQVPLTRHSGGSDVASLTWWNTPGPKTVTVTATNLAGTVTDAHALTITAPEIEVAPPLYHETLVLGELLTRSLVLSNAGPGGLIFELTEADHAPPAGSGPDPFGYRFKDSDEAGGPTYHWIEIAPPAGGSGIQVDLPTVWQGGYAWPISLPFTFSFYGKDYDRLAIGSRGTLSFVDRAIGRENQPLPSVRTFEVETFIAPLWDFLVIDPGAVYYQDLGSMFVVEYYKVSRYGGSDGTWEVVFYDNGNVLFQYQDVYFGQSWGDQGGNATVGIQGDAMTGLQYSYKEFALSDGLAICFAYPGQSPDCSAYEDVSWLSEVPGAGVVEVGGARSIDLVFDAGALDVTGPGDYTTTLVVVSNDLDESLIAVPVTMTISAPSTNTAPVLSGLPDQVFDQPDSPPAVIDLWAYAWDAHTPVRALTYTVEGTPPPGAGVTLSDNRYLHVDPIAGWCGYADVTLRVTDPGGLWDTDTLRVTAHTASQSVAPGDSEPVEMGCLALDCSAGPGGAVTVTLHTTDHPHPPEGAGTMSEYWEVVSDFAGPFTCDLTFGYDENNLNGASEADIAGAARWTDADVRWDYLGGTGDSGANTVTIAGVSAFSPWLLLTSTPPQAVADLGGTRSGGDVQLSWSAVMQDILGNAVTPDHYVVYRRADEPYFEPEAGDIIATPSLPLFTDPGVLGDPVHNYYYVVTAVDVAGIESALSNRLGAFDFGLVPAAGADERAYNLIALNLEVPGVGDADSLAAYVGPGVYMVLRHDAATQGVEWRLPGLAGTDFAIEVGGAYFLSLDGAAPGVVSVVGEVPSRDEVRFSLARAEPGGSCAYNFISVPLHRDDLADADALAADIGGVYTISRYNAATQDLTWRMPGVSGENFLVRVGYPYIVCLDESAPPQWP